MDDGQHFLAHADEVGRGLDRARVAGLDEAPAEVEAVLVRDPARARRHHDEVRGEEQRLLDRCVMKKHILPVACQTSRISLLDRLARERVERAERLVHQQQLGVARERARDAHALLHAAGELVDRALGELLEADQRELVERDAAALRRRRRRASAGRTRRSRRR